LLVLNDQLLTEQVLFDHLPITHRVLRTPITPPFPEKSEAAVFAMGCFWGAERAFWEIPGVFTTAVGYAGGNVTDPTYERVCSGDTGHAEAVLVIFDPSIVSYESLLVTFFENHDPTQGMRQGNDVGTQYRSAIISETQGQLTTASEVLDRYQDALTDAGYKKITTELIQDSDFYYAEPYHQQYLAANPSGYCGVGGTGVPCPTGR
jgi:peptide-methionine (S)-S-oxide reductase